MNENFLYTIYMDHYHYLKQAPLENILCVHCQLLSKCGRVLHLVHYVLVEVLQQDYQFRYQQYHLIGCGVFQFLFLFPQY